MSFTAIWSGNFYHLRNSFGGNRSYKLLRFRSGFTFEKVIDARTYYLQLYVTKAEGNNKKSKSKKPCNINLNLQEGTVKSCSSGSRKKSELHELKPVQCYNLQHISEKTAYDWPAVVIVFDFETTGLNRKDDRIIEIAAWDLFGGKNSTFQTLVNPGIDVRNADIHGIRSHMVNRPDVPRFEELLPIFLQFIRSRQTDGRQVALVAHNARRFDVPFLINEFLRCKVEVPEDWLFVDTLPIAQRLVKSDGSKLESSKLDAVCQFYEIPLIGPAHRAMQDVHTLSYVLQRMTYQLKLTIPELLDKGFRASDITKVTPKEKDVNSNSKAK